jgi:hypothetical protein
MFASIVARSPDSRSSYSAAFPESLRGPSGFSAVSSRLQWRGRSGFSPDSLARLGYYTHNLKKLSSVHAKREFLKKRRTPYKPFFLNLAPTGVDFPQSYQFPRFRLGFLKMQPRDF